MASESPPAAYSPTAKGDAEVLSRRIFPGQGESQEAVRVAPEGETSTAGHMGEQIPMETGDGGHVQFGPHPDTVPETYTVPESDVQPPLKEGGVPIPPVTSVQPGAPENLLEALRDASIVEEHCILMGTVIERVQSVKSGLTEACGGLLTGFEASLLAATSNTAEVCGLKQRLERAEAELSQAKKQLEDQQGM
ncbi:uncharacterized protein [Aegilops tauschii subsp. strangulata]|uniref:uncharacterized protein n=1 Tax=Aegilops tauschii subsp. strangulata TaxID=200361 RepID=UPI001E1CABA3|nr:uncharacterized protein LOC123497212 [Aegilops tauschii subsp. strangulata]